jgi:hypothetical protein
MADAQVSAAARELSRQRWGDQRVRSLVRELEQRREQISAEDRDRLRALAEQQEDRDAVDR